MTLFREEAETFVRLVESGQRGRLQLCLDGEPAARQARRLEEMAHYLQRRGLDVVLAHVDHGADGPGTLYPTLERLPSRRQEYRGLTVEEMDLDAVLARRPQVAVVQDLAHLNVPGARHPVRHQDVEVLLAAGISVLASVDPRQLEELSGGDGPERQRPGLPASFWRQADHLVLVERPGAGDSGEASPLAALPAEILSPPHRVVSAAGVAKTAPRPGSAASCRRLMVCLPSKPERARQLLRGVEEALPREGQCWFAVRVIPSRGPRRPPRLDQACQEASSLGAEVVILQGRDPLNPLLDFASAHGVRHIAVGRVRNGVLKDMLGLSLASRLLRHAHSFDLHILELADQDV